MVGARGVRDLERDRDLGMERGRALRAEIVAGSEREAVETGIEPRARLDEVAHAAIVVRDAVAERGPAALGALDLEPHGHASRREPGLEIEHVSGDPAHSDAFSSFSSLSRVIFICSSAAVPISYSGGLGIRARSRASIWSALFPVAQTMKI